MDAERFDDLARDLWSSATRRRLLRRLAVLPVVGATGALVVPAEESAAKHRHPNHHRSDRRKKRKKRRQGGLGASATCRSLDQLCSVFAGPSCCAGTACRPTAAVLVTTCQAGCTTDQDCLNQFSNSDVECVTDFGACPEFALVGQKCCRPKKCTPERSMVDGTTYFNSRNSQTCSHAHGVCCGTNGAAGSHNCCLPGQICLAGSGCVDNDPDLIELHFNRRAADFCPACTEATSTTCCGNGAKFTCCSANNFCVGSQCRS
jgi:hypothetical protein